MVAGKIHSSFGDAYKTLQEKDTNCKKTIKEAPLSDTPDQL